MSEFGWETTDESSPTTWRRGRARLAEMEVWSRDEERDQVEITAGATARGSWHLDELAFEARVRVGKDARFTWPYSSGAVVPVTQLAAARRTLELTYPVYASMQWVDVWAGQNGTYIAAHDEVPYFKHLRVHAEGSAARRVLVISFAYTDLAWPAGKAWTSPPLVIANHHGDWRAGSRYYRSWADSWFRRDEVPVFMKKSAGHDMISFPTDGGRIPFKDLSRRAAASRKLGIDGVHVADWMEEGFDTFYPAYQADPTLGGEGGLRRAVRRMGGDGAWTCLYLNGRLLDPAGPHGQHAFKWAVKHPPHVKRRFAEMWARTQDASVPGWDPRLAVPSETAPFNRDGTAAEEWWERTLAVMCPAVAGWRELWLSRIEDVARRYRPRMFQVDQVCGCWGMPCYDESHPHHCPGLAWSAYKSFTRAMRGRAKAIDPEIALWSEGVNDMLGQAFDGLQNNLGFASLLAGLGEWDPRIFKHTFPEYILVTGDLAGGDLHALAWMLIIGGHGHFFLQEPAALSVDARQRIRWAVRMRKRYWRELTSREVFVPEVSGDAGVRVMAYRSGKRMLLVGAPMVPVDQPERRFRVSLGLPHVVKQVHRAEWLVDTANARASTTSRFVCRVRGRGPFLLVLR